MEDHAVYTISSGKKIYKYRYDGKRVKETLVSSYLSNPSQILVMDKFLYVLDKKNGMYVIKTARTDNGYASKPKKISSGGVTQIQAMALFRAAAVTYTVYLFSLILLLIGLLLF